MIRRQSNLTRAVTSEAKRKLWWKDSPQAETKSGGKRTAEEQLATVVANTRRNQKRLNRALEAGNTDRATTLAALVAKGMADARRLAESIEEAGRTTFAKRKEAKPMRPIIVWAEGEMERVRSQTGIEATPHLPRARAPK